MEYETGDNYSETDSYKAEHSNSNYKLFLDPVPVHILIVTDYKRESAEGGEGFGTDDFALGLLVKVLTEEGDPTRSVCITKANRNSKDTSADICDFKFYNKDHFPRNYDQVWLFGMENDFRPDRPYLLGEEELAQIAHFMERGKGVFATGDHENLGTPLSGRIPRVRSMRMWQFNGVRPNLPTNAPTRNFEDRHDSTRSGEDDFYTFLDEKDDTPQVIFPILYSVRKDFDICPRSYPHELLCGPRGVIKFLPDHMHEGHCVVPTDLAGDLGIKDFEGLNLEYPPDDQGRPVAPQVIALAQVPEPHATGDREAPFIRYVTHVNSFGLISAYDGFETKAKVGRVVVQSTFHHFVNMNLIGFETSKDTTSKEKGQCAYREIKAYFHNIVKWLTPERKQRHVFFLAVRQALNRYPLKEELLSVRGKPVEEIDDIDVFRVGVAARATIGDIIAPCTALRWSLDTARKTGLKFLKDIHDPWSSQNQVSTPFIDMEVVANVTLGAVILKLANPGIEPGSKATEEEIMEALNRGAKEKLEIYSGSLLRSASELFDAPQNNQEAVGLKSANRESQEVSMANFFVGPWRSNVGGQDEFDFDVTGGTPIIDISFSDAHVSVNGLGQDRILHFSRDNRARHYVGVVTYHGPGTSASGQPVTMTRVRGRLVATTTPSETEPAAIPLDDGDWTATRPPGAT